MRTKPAAARDINDYIAGFPRPVQAILKRVRHVIRKAVPGAQETISYNIPTFKLNGRSVIYFAGWKAHYSLYPANARLIAKFKKELAAYEYNDKGTIRLPLDAPVPEKLIADIAKFRAKEASTPAQRSQRARR